MKCKNKFWLENPADLVCSFTLLPLQGMDLSEQMNSATRLVVVIFLILLLIDIKKALYFLVAGIVLIIILYYIQKERMKKSEGYNSRVAGRPGASGEIREDFSQLLNEEKTQEYDFFDQQFGGDPAADSCCAPLAVVSYGGPPPNPEAVAKEYRGRFDLAREFCADVTPTGSGPDFYSRNQALAGQANPRTLIPPVITPRSHDLEHWRANNLVIHSNINAESFVDRYQSGYEVSNCCNYTCDKELRYVPSDIPGRAPVLAAFQAEQPPTRDYDVPGCNPIFGEVIEENPSGEMFEDYQEDNYDENGNIMEGFKSEPYPPINYNTSYDFPYFSTNQPQTGAEELGAPPSGPRMMGPLKSGMLNVACGYNPENVEVNLPTNAVGGMCERSEEYSDYNKNVYTQTIQPGVYSQSQINRPINSNVGISFQQQLEPVTCQSNDEGVFYTLHDPTIIEPAEYQANDCPQMDSKGQRVNRSNVYDPRFYGYGTSYRSYTDELLGNVKYFYDDINLIKQPNYLVRSKIDSFQFGDSYGPAKKQLPLGSVKALAQDKWLRDSLQHRNGLMQSWTDKFNTILAQKRKAPNSARYYSGCGNRCK